VRSQLGPLKDFAERVNVSISTITHPAKNAGQRAIDHFIGSQAFIAAGRIGHACFEEIVDDKATGRFLFTNPKNNPAVKKPTLAYRIVGAVVGQDRNGATISAPHVVWDEKPVNITADAAVAASIGRGRDNAQDEVRSFLLTTLAKGRKPYEEILDEAKQHGFTNRQLKTAKKNLKIKSEKTGMKGPWFWELPDL
jgi:putative DNA primase/helicase